MEGERIKQVVPVSGDWYFVHNAEDRWFIERVVMWLVMEQSKHAVEHVRACTSNGLPNTNDADHWFVLGSDKSPWGKTWRELYDGTVPTNVLVREFTSAVNDSE